MNHNEECNRCKRPKRSTGAASLTQWIVTCQCDIPSSPLEIAPTEVRLCFVCGKRVANGRVGSFTQWIFRSDICRCATSLQAEPERESDEKLADLPDSIHEPVLEVNADTFPIDRYTPHEEIGRGAAGVVYRCTDNLLRKTVAVKCLRTIARDQLLNFQREAKATSQLQHPSIISILDFGSTVGGAPYMVMDFINGVSLQDVEASEELSGKKIVAIFARAADALSHAHARGVFHRDLKASNILLSGNSEFPEVTIIDFGVAAVKQEHNNGATTLVGTPSYMSADQALGRSFDERSEVYCLGCVLFEALTGRPPFVGETALATIQMHAAQLAPRLSEVSTNKFPPSLEDLVARCLEKDPAKRFESMSEVRNALEQILDSSKQSEPVMTEQPQRSPAFVMTESSRKKSDTLFITVIAGCLILLGATGYFIFCQRPDEPVIESKTPDNPFAVLPDRIMDIGAATLLVERDKKPTSKGNYYSQNASDSDFEAFLSRQQNIHQLDISDATITAKTFKLLAEKTQVQHLLYLRLPIHREIVENISIIKSLEGVHFLTKDMDSRALTALKELPLLRWLSLSGGVLLDTEAYEQIAKFKSLRILDLKKARGVSLEGIQKICSLPLLTDLDLSSSDVSDLTIEPVFKSKLEMINLNQTNISPIVIERLKRLPSIQEIYAPDNNVLRKKSGFKPELVPMPRVETDL